MPLKDSIIPLGGLKQCCRCKTKKPLWEYVQDKHTRDGLYPRCQECRGIKKIRMVASPGMGWNVSELGRRKRYGSPFIGSSCEICSSDSYLVIDHDHDTQKVRGTLCTKCNTMLGKANDSIERLEQAIVYLRRERD